MQSTIQPAFFKQGPKPFSRLLIYASLSLVLLVVDVRWQILQPAREIVSVALYPLQWLATAPVSVAHQVSNYFVTQTALQQENRRLQDERLLANAQLLRMQALQQENIQLRQLLVTRDMQGGRGVLAEVLYNDRDPYTAKLVVDRGEQDHVKAGQVVIDPLGVVGQITRVQPLTAEITLITHKNQPVPVQVVRNGLRAVVYGSGPESPLEVRFMPVNGDIRNDDLLVTSGIDGTYPAGLPVAKVTRVDRNAGSAFARISCEPAADVDKHRFMLILNEKRSIPAKPTPPAAPAKKKGAD
ncbi:rod shape-determining protein MreC [Chitinimonas sp. BJB300]|uniref:rod shape-determining protein MreC n=1 Tax=Chitinimonas sp. BJB300 TaxID=1559339 RepID=UPI000C1126B9|nr:rod shape-determining protein MreC [Chitinimonas sp. BJB300]PHV12641.1 rod shape-determining protein MreC [Chitinimonas sp. BJB300]TSJ91175.1 rod shape-determining protein MreC [Chitinimonas sp. BJB300]